MPAPKIAAEIPLDRVDLDALGDFLMSERSPPECMMLSDLDGFLTGIAVGPALVPPSEWLPVVFGGPPPQFADIAEARAILGSVLGRHNEILRQVSSGVLEPLFWSGGDDSPIASDWAEGFMQAIALHERAWRPLLRSKRDFELLVPIVALCRDADDESLVGLTPEQEESIMVDAALAIPNCVIAIDAYWRAKGPRQGKTNGKRSAGGASPGKSAARPLSGGTSAKGGTPPRPKPSRGRRHQRP